MPFIRSVLDQKQWLCILALVVVSFAVILPVLIKGVPSGYDLPHHYQCAMTFVESIRSGDLYPSWAANRNFGYGGMESRLYPPISHYALALFYLASADWHIATWLTMLFFTFIGSLGVYLWAREYMSPWQAAFAGCVFALLPYHLNQIYNTFFYAEYAGTAILPFTFVYISRVCRRGKLADVVGLGIAFAALVLTHLPLTVIGSFCFVVYGLSKLDKDRLFSQLWRLAAGALLGLGASSFFWIKVVQERGLLAKTLVYADPWLDYSLHFLVTPLQHFDDDLRLQIYQTATLFYDLMFLFGVLLALTFSLPFLRSAMPQFKSLKGVIFVFLFAVFLITPASRVVWDHVSLLQETQFPWRWIAIVCITAPVIAAGGVETLFAWYRTSRRPFALIITGCLIAIVTYSISQVIRPAPFIPKAETETRMQMIEADKGATFWWTIWTRKEALEVTEKVIAEGRAAEITTWSATQKEFRLSPGVAESVRVALFYHPNWKATVNGVPVDASPDENGALLVPVGAAASNVHLEFEETLTVLAARSLSQFIWLFIMFAGLVWYGKKLVLRRGYGPLEPRPVKQPSEYLAALVRLAASDRGWMILAAVSLVMILPMMLAGIYNGGDLPQHAHFGNTFQTSILSGNFYPGWASQENLGYGALGVRFYPPLEPFVWAGLRILSGDWHSATWVMFWIFTFVGGLGTYVWAKEFIAAQFAVLAGVLFILMPYHLFEIYNGSQYAEFSGCSVITFSFFFATRVCRRTTLLNILGLAISYGVLVFTHLPSTVIGSLALAIYCLALIRKANLLRTVGGLGLSVGLGLAATSVYWIKVVTEQSWIRKMQFWKDSRYDFHFNYLLTSPWFDDRNLWFFNTILLLQVFVIIAAFIHLQGRKDRAIGRYLKAIFVLSGLSIFMTTVVSQSVWEFTPYLHEVQFPWRWMTISSIGTSVIAAAAFESVLRTYGRFSYAKGSIQASVGIAAITLIFLIAAMALEFQRMYIPPSSVDSWITRQDETMGGEFFWTPQTREEAFSQGERIEAGDRVVSNDVWDPEHRHFIVQPGIQTTVRVATLYYPLWQARVNDQLIPTGMDDNGVLNIDIPPDRSSVDLTFEEPTRVRFAAAVSIFAWCSIAAVLGFIYVSRRTFRDPV